MGTLIGWQCSDCGEGEQFFCGGGMMDFADQETVAKAQAGAYGPAMGALIGSGIPDGWTVFRQNTFYECPGCGGVVPGETLTIDDKSGGWLVYHMPPEACAECGGKLAFWDERTPLPERELRVRCEQRAQQGCPNCGGKNVRPLQGYWD